MSSQGTERLYEDGESHYTGKKKRTKEQIDDIWANLRQVPSEATCIYILLAIGAAISLVVLGLGVLLAYKSSTIIGKVLIAFGVIAIGVLWDIKVISSYMYLLYLYQNAQDQ